MTENFKDHLVKLASGDYDSWKSDKEGKLAAILLADQFSRNIFRKQKQAFDYDHIGLGLAKSIKPEELFSYNFSEQIFLQMPYQHSESKEDQEKSLEVAKSLISNAEAKGASEGVISFYQAIFKFAVKHAEIIEQFGRFPHRNELLGRESTEAEISYLTTAERFG